MLTPKAVAALMLERVRHHVRLLLPQTEASTESLLEGVVPPDQPRASSQGEL